LSCITVGASLLDCPDAVVAVVVVVVVVADVDDDDGDPSLASTLAASAAEGRKSLSMIAPLRGGICFLDHSSVVDFVKSGGGMGGGSKSEGEEEKPLEREELEDIVERIN
jgi:hypothetical protein